VKDTQNVTLSIPKSLLQKLKIYAASHNKSMSAVMTELVEATVTKDQEYEQLKRRFLARLEKPPGIGTGGKITWTRDELYER
jgi:hypothetical protein